VIAAEWKVIVTFIASNCQSMLAPVMTWQAMTLR
jgi:hypothetical protein